MVNQERDLLDAIIAQPDDDLPRLVYADWLDEQGRSERAELIRLQIQLVNSDFTADEADAIQVRCLELIERNWDEWLGCRVDRKTPVVDFDRYFRRGFIEDVLSGNGWTLDQIAEMMRVHPIAKLDISIDPYRLPDWPFLSRIRELVGSDCQNPDSKTLGGILHSPHLTGLQTLDVNQFDLDESDFEYLGTDPKFAGLRSIRNVFDEFSGHALMRILSRPNFRRLTELFFPNTEFSEGEFHSFCQNPLFGSLRKLNIDPTRFINHPDGFDFAIRYLPMPELQSLVLRSGVKDDLLQTIIQQTFIPQLEELSLSMTPGFPIVDSMRQLFCSGIVKELKSLSLNNVQMHSQWAELLRDAHLPKLRTLSVFRSDFDDQAVRGLADSCLAKSLQELKIRRSVVSDEGAIRLTKDFAFQIMQRLSLSSPHVGREGANALSHSRFGRQITWLDLWEVKYQRGFPLNYLSRPLSDWPEGY